MRLYLLLFAGLLNCSPALYGTWHSGPNWIRFKRNHVFQTEKSDGVIFERWYTTKTYDYNKRTYIEKCGPGKDTVYYDRIYMKSNDDTVPAFEYLLRPDTLLMNAFEDSVGVMYLRSPKK